MCDRVVSDDPILIVCCPDKYTTPKICDEAVDDCLAALKLIPYWFVASKIIKKLFTALHADENKLYFNEGSGDAIFNCNEMGILRIDLNNTNLDDNFDEDETVILIRLLAWHIRFGKRKELIKALSEKLMPVAWHPDRWFDRYMSKDEK